MDPNSSPASSSKPGDVYDAQLAARPASSSPPPSGPPSPTPAMNYGYPPQPIVIQTRGTFQRLLGWLGWMGFFFCAVMLIGYVSTFYEYFNVTEGIQEKYHSGAKFGRDKVAIIDISGVIMEGEGFVKRQIDLIREDRAVRAVVIRVDSPGGTVTGADYIYHHLKKLKAERNLPMVVSMGSIAASGGYYVSMAVGNQERAIFAEPTTTTGSIGVIIPHYDISQLLARFDVKDDSIASHPRKQMLSMTKALSDEDRAILMSYVNESLDRFKSIVKEGRPAFAEDGAKLDELATGEIFTANQAKKHGLVDELGFIEEAIDRAIELAALDKKTVRVVRYQRPPALFEFPGMASASAPRGDLAMLLELSAPRAWFLSSSLPPLVKSSDR